MKILVLTGSPHPKGTTALLADAYCGGAEEAGHEVIRFDTAKMDISHCAGCDYCRRNSGECVFADDMMEIYPSLMEAETITFVTPLYYFGMTAQLKRTVDRFYAVNPNLREKGKKAYLLSAGADPDPWIAGGIIAHLETMCRYLHWEFAGSVIAYGAAVPEDLKETDYLAQARQMGIQA